MSGKSSKSTKPGLLIVLMGVSGAGKSTLGRQLADRLQMPFLEGDEFHSPSNVAKMAAGIPLQDEDRWPWIDAIAAAIMENRQRHRESVAACSLLKRRYRDRLRAHVGGPLLFVHLVADRETLRHRLTARPSHFMPAKLLDSQLEALEAPHPDEPALTMRADAAVDQLVSAIQQWSSSQRPFDAERPPQAQE